MTANFIYSKPISSIPNNQDLTFPCPSSYPMSSNYSIYEKALKKELLPHPVDKNKYDHQDFLLDKSNNLSSRPSSRNQNRPPGPGGLDSSSLKSSQARSLSPAPLETATDEDLSNRGNQLTKRKSSQGSYCIPNSYENQGSYPAKTNDNGHYSNVGLKLSNLEDVNNNWLDSYLNRVTDLVKSPYNSRLVEYADEHASTKDNSVIENNITGNPTLLKNLENLTGFLNEVKPQAPSNNVKQVENNRMRFFPSNGQSSSFSTYVMDTKGNYPSKFQFKIEVDERENSPEDYNYELKQQDFQYERIVEIPIMAQQTRGRPLTGIQGFSDPRTHNEVKITYKQVLNKRMNNTPPKGVPYINVQMRQSKTPIRTSDIMDKTEHIAKQYENINQNERSYMQNSRQGYHFEQGNSNKSIKQAYNLVQRNSKDSLSPVYHNVNITGNDKDGRRRSSREINLSQKYQHIENNKLNYGQLKIGTVSGIPTEEVTLSRNGNITGQAKAYWQLKNGDSKLEDSKKNTLNILLKNAPFQKETREASRVYMEPISRDSEQLSPYSRNSNNNTKRDNPYAKVVPIQSVTTSSNSSFLIPSRVTSQTNIDRYTHQSSHNTTFDDPSSYNGSRLNTKREISLETKRGLSGKAHIKTGDEPEKELFNYTDNFQEAELLFPKKKLEQKPKASYAKDKVLQIRERSNYETGQQQPLRKTPQEPNSYFFQKAIRGRGASELSDDKKIGSKSFELQSVPSSKSIPNGKIEQGGRSLSENRSSSKDILRSLRDFSDNVVQSAKDLFQKVGNHKTRTKCSCAGNLKANDETCPKAQKWLFSKYKRSELAYLKKTYEKIRDLPDIHAACKKQIGLDIKRTHPDFEYFAGEGEGIQVLERLLQCYAKYDPKIGYVQGMNFIAASILYHAEEFVAFWILIQIFEKAEMRDIYMQDLPGLAKHSQIVDFLILNNLPNLYTHFCTHNIIVEMFCTEWICGLFGSVIPLDKIVISTFYSNINAIKDHFLDGFITHGWPFFYKFVLALLKSFEKELREATDMSEILLIFKSGINKRERNVFSGNKTKVDWNQIIKYAYQIELDTSFINKLLMKFDQETKRFVLNSKY